MIFLPLNRLLRKKNILGNENLQKIGIDIAKKSSPYHTSPRLIQSTISIKD